MLQATGTGVISYTSIVSYQEYRNFQAGDYSQDHNIMRAVMESLTVHFCSLLNRNDTITRVKSCALNYYDDDWLNVWKAWVRGYG